MAIIEAAMRGFAQKGFAATTTREIAALAGCNIAAISYYFGGKEGLRAACAEQIVAVLTAVTQSAAGAAPPPTEAEARRALVALVRRMAHFLLLRPEAGLVAGFMVREMAQPSEALDTIYAGVIEAAHRRVCGLWAAATGQDAESEAVKLAVFSTLGQIVYFHVGRPVVERRLGWSGVSRREARAIAATVTRNLIARLDVDRREPS